MILNSGLDTLFVDSLRIQSTNGLTGNSFTIVDMKDTITSSPPDTMFINVAFNPAAVTSYFDSLVIYHRKSSISAIEIKTLALSGTGQTSLIPSDSLAVPDSTADVVIGQSNFTSNTSGTSQTAYNHPNGIALDTTVSPPVLYVADSWNNRILGYYNYPFIQNGSPADFVIGQTDFASNTSGVTSSKFSTPDRIFVDSGGNLWVADMLNNRVLVFITPTTTDYLADFVFGQLGSFTSGTMNNGGITPNSLYNPHHVAFDNQNRAYITDRGNHRILIYNDPLNTDTQADYVIGQVNFSSNSSSASDSTLYEPEACIVADNGDLFIIDKGNNRILKFNDPLNTNKKADFVFGQGGSFTSGTANNPERNSESLNSPNNGFIDENGRLFVCDASNHRVLVFNTPFDSTADYVFGQNGSFTSGTSSTTAEGLYSPSSVLVDSDGNVLIADYENHRILKFLKENPAHMFLSTTMLNFGIVDTALSDTLNVKIMNSGSDTLFIDSVLFASSTATSGNCFTVLDTMDTVTNVPADSMIIRTVFSPDSAVNYSDTLVISYRIHADSSSNVQKVPVRGTSFMFGDVSGDYTVSSFDASLILQHTVKKITLTGDSLTRADVSGNGSVRAYDASMIMRYVSGYINSFLAELMKSSPDLKDTGLKFALTYDEENKILSIPVSIANARNIYAMQIKLSHPGLEFKEIKMGDIISGFMSESDDKNSTLSFAGAGSSPIEKEGTVITFMFNVVDEAVINNLEIKEIILNETEYDISNVQFDKLIPKVFKLSQNYPNPFNPETTIKYQLPKNSKVTLEIYNILGQKVKTLINSDIEAGYHSIRWNGRNDRGITAASGVYIYMIRTNTGYFKTKKMVFLK